jgi:hypothetical protein
MKFSPNVKVFDNGVINNEYIKTWDGLSPSSKMFENIILISLNKNYLEINKYNLIELTDLVDNFTILIQRFIHNPNKSTLTILYRGGGKNSSILVNQYNFNLIYSLYKDLLTLKNFKNEIQLKY